MASCGIPSLKNVIGQPKDKLVGARWVHDDLDRLAVWSGPVPTDYRVVLERFAAVEARKLLMDVPPVPRKGEVLIGIGLGFLSDSHARNVSVAAKAC